MRIVYGNGFMSGLKHKVNQIRTRKSVTDTMICQEIIRCDKFIGTL